jgi:hypothetical protein
MFGAASGAEDNEYQDDFETNFDDDDDDVAF